MSARLRLLAVILLALAPAVAVAQDDSNAYTEGVYNESVTGDLGKAIELYRQAAAGSSDPALVARAILRTGNCQKKLGQIDKARESYRKVVDGYPGQTEVVRLAKLARLTLGPGEEGLQEWTDRLRTEVVQLRSALGALSSNIETLKKELPGGAGEPGEAALRVFENMVLREETRRSVKSYLASHYFKTGLAAYRALNYERALGDFRIAKSMNPDDRLIRGYVEKTEFILGRLSRLTPDAMNNAPDNPSAMLLKEMQAALQVAEESRREGDNRMALAAIEEILDRVRWTDDDLITDEIRTLLEKADKTAYECLIRVYPAESRDYRSLSTERQALARKLKEKLSELLSAGAQPRETTAEVIEEAGRLFEAGQLPQAKLLLEKHMVAAGDSPEVSDLLDRIDRRIRGEEENSERGRAFEVESMAFSLPAEELNMLKLPFRAVKTSEEQGVPFVHAVVGEEKAKEILSVAALAGRDAMGSLPEMSVLSGERGSSFLGSSMSYVSGFRKTSGAGSEEYEAVTDVVFQGIKLAVTPRGFTDGMGLRLEATVSVIVGDPQTVQTEGGQIEIPRVYQTALKHEFRLARGQRLVIGPFPNTLAPGGEKDEQEMYLIISPREIPSTGAAGEKGGR
jgi:tetratricopeptide (TPR) repeat protein